ncbi:hypothetical protein [Escherichia coli]|uniref:hypothetical protein n=1 Tax=Escherichia coli TaxID=562 RepID=UPI004048A722
MCVAEGLWKVPDDLPEQGRRYDAQRLGGVTVELNDYTNYYIKVDYQNGLSERSEKTWQGTTGVSLYW